jgi:catechol 2,3-dioxygenase-like lactoylglutathione lyase family enzyme
MKSGSKLFIGALSFRTRPARLATGTGVDGVTFVSVRIDHVIYATGDLDAGTARVEDELGLTAVEGGRHEGHGTVNRVVPLGRGYLELVAVADPEEAASSAFGRAVQERLAHAGDGLMGWAVAVDDIGSVAARLRTSSTTISRAGLTARLAGMPEALREPFLPFFIARDVGVVNPGAAGNAGGITWLEVSGDSERLARWLGGAPLPVGVVAGPAAVRAIRIGDRELWA